MPEDKYRLTTVKHVLEYYMENKGFGAESWHDLAHMTRIFIEVMGNKRLADLQPDHFNAYCSGRKRGAFGSRKAKATGTLRRELVHLRTAIKFCAQSKLVHPEHIPYIPMPDHSPARDRWLSKDEIEALKKAAEPWSRGEIFLRIALATAARKNVIETLEWDQVSFATGMITFGKTGAKITKKKKPTLPMTGELRLYLEQLKAQQADMPDWMVKPSPYVLGSSSDIRHSLDAIAHRAGVRFLSPHVLRHTWATHASMNGVGLDEIARVLGDSILTVEKVYAKFQPGYLKTAIEQGAL